MIVKLDGVNFKKLCHDAKTKIPYDDRLHDCMLAAAKATMLQLHASVAYIAGDEVTLLVPDDSYGGDAQKVISIAASAMTFAFYTNWIFFFNPAPTLFKASYVFPKDAVSIFDKNRFDYEGRFVHTVSRLHFSHQDLLGCNRVRQRAMLYSKGVDFDGFPAHQRLGLVLFNNSGKIAVDRSISPFTKEYLCPDSVRSLSSLV